VIAGLLLVGLWVACVGLWIVVPVGWLWIGSQVQGATDNVGAAIGVMIPGFTVSVIAVMWILGALNRAYQRARVARGREDTGSFPLETTLVCTAMLSLVAFVIWFIAFNDSAPLPIPEP
jgi:hypothetical protein